MDFAERGMEGEIVRSDGFRGGRFEHLGREGMEVILQGRDGV
jgi:hypothetical protein